MELAGKGGVCVGGHFRRLFESYKKNKGKTKTSHGILTPAGPWSVALGGVWPRVQACGIGILLFNSRWCFCNLYWSVIMYCTIRL